jgi:tetratricopeptide (TPR) repeat protein
MFLSLLFLVFTLQTDQSEDISRWLGYLERGNSEELREAIRQEPDRAKAAVESLIADFDHSIHSWRDAPEQRRVNYSDTLLDSGLELSQMVTEVTGDDFLQRRFEARRDRVTATELLNDGDFEEALSVIQEVRATARLLEDQSFLFSTYLSSAYAHLGMGMPEKTLEDSQTALQIATRIGEEVKYTLALFNLGTAYLHLGQNDEALRYSSEAAESAAQIGNSIWEANAWLNVGYVEITQRNNQAAAEAFGKALSLSQKAGDPLGEGRAYYNLGIAYLNQEEWGLAREHLESSLRFIRDIDIRHSHDIDEYNYVEKFTLEALLNIYEQLNLEDSAVIDPVRHRLEEFASQSLSGDQHAH